ncbi:hypothetical protein C0J52_09152 [Blattella germanica]|nr:hypothetical protein C0J52_09152 [Blattella germanica]
MRKMSGDSEKDDDTMKEVTLDPEKESVHVVVEEIEEDIDAIRKSFSNLSISEQQNELLNVSSEETLPSHSEPKDSDENIYNLKWIVWHGRKFPIDLPEVRQLNYEQNMSDAISVLPRLHTGLNVNVNVQAFEYTPECIIFDLLNIPLYHGWLIDPQCSDVIAAVGSLGYNQIVERIINNKSSDVDELVTEALIAEQFLERTASQLTYHGLCELHAAMRDEELAVLFRNNHFSTILKHRVCIPTDEEATGLVGMPQDCLVALSLEEEQKQLQGTVADWKDLLKQEISSHEDLTQRFHEDDRRHTHNSIPVGAISHGHARPFPHASTGERSKKGSCGIL